MRNWRKLLLLMGREGRNLPLQTVSFTTDWYVDLQNKILPGCKVRFTEICIYSIQKYEAVPVMSSSAQHVCLTLWPYWGMQICKVLCHPEMPQVCIMFSHMLSFCLLFFRTTAALSGASLAHCSLHRHRVSSAYQETCCNGGHHSLPV